MEACHERQDSVNVSIHTAVTYAHFSPAVRQSLIDSLLREIILRLCVPAILIDNARKKKKKRILCAFEYTNIHMCYMLGVRGGWLLLHDNLANEQRIYTYMHMNRAQSKIAG